MVINKVMLIGNVGREVEVRTFDQNKVARFSIALTERTKDKDGNVKENTEWFRVVAWKNIADFAEKYLAKGRQIYLEGRLRTNSYTGKDGQPREQVEIIAERIMPLGRQEAKEGQQQRAPQNVGRVTGYTAPQQSQPQMAQEDNGEDLPF